MTIFWSSCNHFGEFLGTFGTILGPSRAPLVLFWDFGVISGTILGPSWAPLVIFLDFSVISRPFWGHFEHFRCHFEILASSGEHSRDILGSFWDDFGIVWGHFRDI